MRLGAGRLEGRGGLTITFPKDTWVDREPMREGLRRSRALQAAGDAYGSWEAAQEALVITRNELLPGLDAAWLEPFRAELQEHRLELLEAVARAGAGLGDGELSEAEAAARAAVEAAPNAAEDGANRAPGRSKSTCPETVRILRSAGREVAATAADRGRRDRLVALCEGTDHWGDLRALRRDRRCLGQQGDAQPDHRQGDRGEADTQVALSDGLIQATAPAAATSNTRPSPGNHPPHPLRQLQ